MIEIKTHLHEGIYRSHGGGQTLTAQSFNTGPRNLLRAVRALSEERRSNIACYGNIGCGRSWLEIDGECVDEFDLTEMTTEKARSIIATHSSSGAIGRAAGEKQ